MSDNDHDLLVRIDERVQRMQQSFDAERVSAGAREAKREAEFELFRHDVSVKQSEQDDNINGLKMLRAQVYAIAGTISVLVTIIVKIFWS